MTVAELPVASGPTPPPSASPPAFAPPRQHILVHDVSWDYYERTLHELDEQHFRITYDEGRMEIMSPSARHEGRKTLIGQLIELYATETDLWFVGLGSVTCRRADIGKGVEPDECYYVTHRPRDLNELDLSIDPPPDLAVEVDVTSGSIARQPIYAAIGVPEIWRFDGQSITVLLRQASGAYESSPRSLVFPQLDMNEFNRFLAMGQSDPFVAVRAFRAWLRGK